jgi:hypothetical protein
MINTIVIRDQIDVTADAVLGQSFRGHHRIIKWIMSTSLPVVEWSTDEQKPRKLNALLSGLSKSRPGVGSGQQAATRHFCLSRHVLPGGRMRNETGGHSEARMSRGTGGAEAEAEEPQMARITDAEDGPRSTENGERTKGKGGRE